uniref:C2H2-type domain-containing protein n=1 Tax=Oryzias latipes TaxID=8090 RepID=A0A3B3IKJ1_ORYLA
LSYDPVVETNSGSNEDNLAPLSDDSSFSSRTAEGGGGSEDEEAASPGGLLALDVSPREANGLLSYQVQSEDSSHLSEYSYIKFRPLDRGSKPNDYFLKEEFEDSDDDSAAIVEYLQRSDTIIIYPEAPEEAKTLRTAEATSPKENKHGSLSDPTDDFAQLLTCPYCERGYKRLTSLKEHIMNRHKRNDESFACQLCTGTFDSSSLLDRHMTTHKLGREKPPPLSEEAENRKFKCSECGKAFKYKHHLKEHLRIHSGEKPYECSNCKKRFSHSGSYSSHISSKKCIGLLTLNGQVHNGNFSKSCSFPRSRTLSPESPTIPRLHPKLENGQPLFSQIQQGQPHVRGEPNYLSDYHLLMASQHVFEGTRVYLNGHGLSSLGIHSSPQSSLSHLGSMEVDLPLLSYTGPPVSSLSEVQKLLHIMDNNGCRQNPEKMSQMKAYMKELEAQIQAQAGFPAVTHSSPTRSITDYTLKKVREAKSLINKEKKQVRDKKEKSNHSGFLCSEEKSLDEQTLFLPFCCQFCKQTFPGPIALHQHERYLCKMNEEIRGVLEPAENLLSGRQRTLVDELSLSNGATSPTHLLKDHFSVLNACFAVNTEPSIEEVGKLSHAVAGPQEFVKEWFANYESQNHQMGSVRKKSLLPNHSAHDHHLGHSPKSLLTVDMHCGLTNGNSSQKPEKTNHFGASRQPAGVMPHELPDILKDNTLSPLNLSNFPSHSTFSKNSQIRSNTPSSLISEETLWDIPLDLSLPRNVKQKLVSVAEKQVRPKGLMPECNVKLAEKEQACVPSDLISVKTEVLDSDIKGNFGHQPENSASPLFGIDPFYGGSAYTPLSPHGAFTPPTFRSSTQSTNVGLRGFSGLNPMSLLPHMAYTYTAGTTFAEMQQQKYQHKVSLPGELLDKTADYLSGLDNLTDSNSMLSRKKIKKTESGMYACDLCDKTFQKTSSLLRHKYEHTGKRPHQCQTCKKAFKHKHHLIEHSRLHSGEKPYQCDKCGKRFSHSGSYSQHMNHRYSYCKREADEREAAEREAQEQGVSGLLNGGLEPSERMMGTTYLQKLEPLGSLQPNDQEEPCNNVILRDGRETGAGQDEKEVDSRKLMELTDRQAASFMKKEEEEEQSLIDMTTDEEADQRDITEK